MNASISRYGHSSLTLRSAFDRRHGTESSEWTRTSMTLFNIRSTTSGMTGDTGNTVPQSHESFADTISYEQTPEAEMQGTFISEPDRSTTDDQSSMNNGPTSILQNSKRNDSDDGWTLHGSARAAALLAHKVATSVIPRGRGGEQP